MTDRATAGAAAAERRIARRRALVPPIEYPHELPITERRDDILTALRDNQVVVVAGETGSGKSTQLPKLCLELGRGVDGLIGHTQPRRLAARAVAERVAEELRSEIGGLVGYTVRFTDRVGENTLVKVMTDGILLAEIQRDRQLSRYDTIIIDEAHERGLNIDFLLGYLTQLLPRRRDLKLIITSATIDTERFARHFGGAPVIEVSGRTYPVDVVYAGAPDDQVQGICDAVATLADEVPGDVLVFLSGEREIRDTAEALRRMDLHHTEILPLYARLSAAEQHRIFDRHTGRRVVLATNVAETSLTVPGIVAVVDPGTARISRYNRRTKVQRLPIEPISQASANQRAGRCGRVAPGVCIRLYDEDDFAARPEFTEPEILRTNLASVVLQMTALGLGDVKAFPFVEPPDPRDVADGVALLEELGAIETNRRRGDGPRLTPIGRKLARLPVDPRLGRMVLEAEANGCAREVMVIAAALSIQDPRERPTGKEEAAAEAHRRFAAEGSDLIAYLNLWDHLRDRQRELTSNQFRRMCRSEHLNYLRVREWQDLFSQLRSIAGGLGIHVGSGRDRAPADSVHRAVLAGLLSHLGMHDPVRRDYLGARNARFAIAPGSVLFKKQPRWVMAAELVETSRLWARNVAAVQPEWAERLAGDLAKRTYGEPRWDRRRGAAVATERVTLYGLPLVAGRTVDLARIDGDLARELFIRHALVDAEWDSAPDFVAANEAMVEAVRAVEDRARRRDLLVDDETRYEFFDERMPDDVVSGRHFAGWWKRLPIEERARLQFTFADLVDPAAGRIDLQSFPDAWVHGDLALPLSYVFDPGGPDDGVTVHVPLAWLNRLGSARFDWHVSGHRLEMVTSVLRALPKDVRRDVSPASEHAAAFLADHGPADGPFADVLTAWLRRRSGAEVTRGDIALDRLPPHLRLVIDVEGSRGTDIGELAYRLHGRMRAMVAAAARAAGLERSGLREWPDPALAPRVDLPWAGTSVRGYPTLVDEGDAVGVRVVPYPSEQRASMWASTRRLLLLAVPPPRKALDRLLDTRTKLALGRSPYPSVGAVLDDCIVAAMDDLMGDAGGVPSDVTGFHRVVDTVRGDLVERSLTVAGAVAAALESVWEIEHRLGVLTADAVQPAVEDIVRQVSSLVFDGYVAVSGARRTADIVRYLQAVERRLDRLPEGPQRDAQRMARVQTLEARTDALADHLGAGDAGVRAVRWMIEELRVSLWAQSLGTPYPVSEERITRALARLAEERT